LDILALNEARLRPAGGSLDYIPPRTWKT